MSKNAFAKFDKCRKNVYAKFDKVPALDRCALSRAFLFISEVVVVKKGRILTTTSDLLDKIGECDSQVTFLEAYSSRKCYLCGHRKVSDENRK